MAKQYWLFKSEPSTFSIDDLENQPKKTEHWDGVRNYQARNFMRDDIKKGDLVFFYHSNCTEPGIVGICEVVKEAYPDHTAFDKKSKYYDEKSTPDKPRWFMVDVKYKTKFQETLPLSALKENPKLKDFALVKKGNRLSIMPVTSSQWQAILAMMEEHVTGI